MNFYRPLRGVLLAGILGAVFWPQSSPAIFGINIFNRKKEQKSVASPEMARVQETNGSSSLAAAAQLEQEGKTGAAIGICKRIIKESPLTEAAGSAQFTLGELYEKDGDAKKAFEAYQAFIENYKSSPQFNTALNNQYRIAESLKSVGVKKKILKVIPLPSGSDDVIEMFTKIRANAPFGRLAPQAQFSVGEIHQNRGKLNESAAAYQVVVDNYPDTALAKEAQYRIGALYGSTATKSQDAANIQKSRDATQTYIATYPNGERIQEAKQNLMNTNDEEAMKVYRIAQYYDRQGNSRAAAIYYNDVLSFSQTKLAGEAQRRLAVLTRNNPKLLTQTPLNQSIADASITAKTKLKTRDDYFGPLAPTLANNNPKPKMLIEKRDVRPVSKRIASTGKSTESKSTEFKSTDPNLIVLPPEDSGSPMIVPPLEEKGKTKTTVKPETKKSEGGSLIETSPLGSDPGAVVIPPTETPSAKPEEAKPNTTAPKTGSEEKSIDQKAGELPPAKPAEKKTMPSSEDAPLLSPTPAPGSN